MNRQNTIRFLEDEGVGVMQTSLEAMFYAERAGQVYFVDGNKTDNSGDGSTWAKAFKYLSTALAASHANIALAAARNWAGRNTIFVKGDPITENLVLLADKTDVIGVGACDAYSMPQIVGNHVPLGAIVGMSCRFFNMQFRCPAGGGAIWTLIQGGIEFYGCHFNGWQSTPATIGVLATAAAGLKISGCRFDGVFSTAAISLGAGNGNGILIEGNNIQSGAIGILVNESFTCANQQAYIKNNTIKAVTLIIDENSDKIVVVGNRGTTAANAGATTYDLNLRFAVDNVFSSGNVDYAEAVPVIRWGTQS